MSAEEKRKEAVVNYLLACSQTGINPFFEEEDPGSHTFSEEEMATTWLDFFSNNPIQPKNQLIKWLVDSGRTWRQITIFLKSVCQLSLVDIVNHSLQNTQPQVGRLHELLPDLLHLNYTHDEIVDALKESNWKDAIETSCDTNPSNDFLKILDRLGGYNLFDVLLATLPADKRRADLTDAEISGLIDRLVIDVWEDEED